MKGGRPPTPAHLTASQSRLPWATPLAQGALNALLLCASILFLCGFRLPLLEQEGVTVVFTTEAERIEYAEPLIGTLEVTTRAQDEARLPDLRERFQGFSIIEDFAAGRTERGATATTAWRFRLTPGGEAPYRLRPFVLTLRDTRTGAERKRLTRVANFPAPLPLPEAAGAPECDLQPEWVAPGWRTFGLWGLYLLGVGILLAALFPLLRRVRRTLHERALSPEARAWVELDRLLAEGLLAQGKVKRFYFGLTGVVRRYFERACALRATRQTTEEFLAHLTDDPTFAPAEREALSAFLAAADRIKFAGITATPEEATASTASARALIQTHATRHTDAHA